MAVFEREVEHRLWATKAEPCPQHAKENGDLNGLSVHSEEPRLLTDSDFRDDDNFVMHSSRGRHRQKHDDRCILPHSILVARSVSRAEYIGNKKAMEAYWKEWANLERKQVWRWESLREWDDVAEEARLNNSEVHFRYMFGIMVEKGSEFPDDDPRRYFKYRVVFQGNQVKDQNWEVAMFSETASTPATLEASRIADIYSCFVGSETKNGTPVKHTMQSRDVEQAYLQADLEGSDTYIMLPHEMWTPEMKKMK